MANISANRACESMAVALLLLTIVYICGISAKHHPYPVSGSWFKDRNNETDLNHTLSQFKSIGGDTVLALGAEIRIREPDDIKNDPDFKDCAIDGVDCVTSARKLVSDKGLDIAQWLTYSHGDNYTQRFAKCEGFDRRIQIGRKVYYQLILWAENECEMLKDFRVQVLDTSRNVDRDHIEVYQQFFYDFRDPADCRFESSERVSIMFTYYSGDGDTSELLLKQAQARNMSVYLGLPQLPSSVDLHHPTSQPFFLINYRIMADHYRRGFNNHSAMKGYYSDAEVVLGHIINPPMARDLTRLAPPDVLLLWRRLSFEARQYNISVIGAPGLNLTHASNTTLQGHLDGLQELLVYTWLKEFIIRDSRGDGQASYFWQEDYDQPISYRDKKLLSMLQQRNSSVNDRTSYKDIYYASISDFFRAYGRQHKPTWLMIEAYNTIKDEQTCQSAGIDSGVQSVDKSHLDKALTHVGSLVQKVTAYAWDPLFTCTTASEKTSLAQQIERDYNKSIPGECRYLDPPNNLTIAMTGFNLDSPGDFRVAYQFFTCKEGANYIKANYVEPDYGIRNGLVKSLTYVEIPFSDFSDLARNGTIMVLKTDNYNEYCQFRYSLPDPPFLSSKYLAENDPIG